VTATLGDMNTTRARVIGYFALAGVVLPLVLGVFAFATHSLGMRSVGEGFEIIATGSCPPWLLLAWAVSIYGDNWILFVGLLAAVLSLNAILYSLLGLLYSLTAGWAAYWRVALVVSAYLFIIAAAFSAAFVYKQSLATAMSPNPALHTDTQVASLSCAQVSATR
jgi:hypothetical protein